jgi:integrase
LLEIEFFYFYILVYVPLLPKAMEILDKYKNHPAFVKKGECLAVPSNVKYNAYFKEVGDIAGIPKNKPLVTHLARKTFATTIALTNGMNIGVLSKIFGHNSIKVTLDSYGTIIDELMLSNVKELKEKLSLKQQQDSNSDTGLSPDTHINLLFNINDLSKN